MPTRPARHSPRYPVTPKHNAVVNWGRGRGVSTSIWAKLREQRFAMDGYLCQACLPRLTPVELHGKHHGILDHIKPVSAGGTDDIDNLQTLCQSCSKAKTQQERMRSRRIT